MIRLQYADVINIGRIRIVNLYSGKSHWLTLIQYSKKGSSGVFWPYSQYPPVEKTTEEAGA